MTADYRLALLTDAHVFGGAEQFLRTLVVGLPHRVHITVIGTDHRIVSQVVNRAEGVASMVIRRGCLSAWRALRQVRPDVVQVNLSQVNGSRALIVAAILLRLPIVAVDHGPAPGLSWRGRMLQRVFSSRIAARVSVSDQSARDVEKYAGLPRNLVQTIRNGVPRVEPCPPAPPGNELTVGMLARLDPVKGIDLTIRAIAQLANVRLEVGGTGPARDELVDLVNELGVGDRVTFLGHVRDPMDVLCGFDVVALPSRSEGLPLVLLEAMHAHRPVIVSNVGAMAEVVEDHVCGLVVEPDSVESLAHAIAEYRDDPNLRRSCADNALTLARDQMSAERMVDEYDELFSSLATARSGARS